MEHNEDTDHDHDSGHGHKHHEKMFKKKFFISTILSLPVLYFSTFVSGLLGYTPIQFTGSNLIVPIFSIIIFGYGGLPFLKMAKSEAEDRQPGMMMLISLAITVAFTYSMAALFLDTQSSFFWELVTLIDIMLLGHWIEMRSVRQASGALDELAQLMPDTAEKILENGTTEEVKVSQLENGDKVLIRPGASIPADGEVIEGESDVNESMITGESAPVSKKAGDEVIGGTVNKQGSLRIEITATGDETALSGIMKLVEEAQESQSKTQMLADKAAGWLFYIALGSGILTSIAWTIAVGFDVTVIERVVTVLVIACPHALGLAVPLVVAINTSMAAKNGILVRDRVAMEQARTLDTVIFDKTGTLTEGEMGVADIKTAEISEDDALKYMAAVESDSEHTIAQAIRNSAEQKELEVPEASGFEAIKGKGVKAKVKGETVHVGGPNLAKAENFKIPEALKKFADKAAENAETAIYLFRDGEAVAAVGLADVIREESREAIEKLHNMGIEVAMLTGDSEEVAEAVANELGIDTFFAQVLPEDKDQKVQQLQDQDKKVAMVGDGVNDAPALTRADVGIAIGSGTDVAVESADIILVQNNPLDIVKLFNLSNASYSKMKQNLFWATGYNALAIPLAAGVLAPIGIMLSPAVGAVVMSLSTVIVAVNAQLLKKKQI
ncbi:copper-translocating P-type ATPase [Candidatus Nanohalobium constans]|uniref:Copper-translocating P-type ATPase n=1 Tax=Candidatus Nanohalobium constans TaxID=2565781 RepID=A0A5Q0UH35_9ARCH|nr:copper-translocating P-type ATPase [Candidatus Nanohalobium constans]QGA80896.1 copper-translocating P-type ATPase [Candidatus Nanohalobium constans]